MELGAAFFTRLHVSTDSEVPLEFTKNLIALASKTIHEFSCEAQVAAGRRQALANIVNREEDEGIARLVDRPQPFLVDQSNRVSCMSMVLGDTNKCTAQHVWP